jgi:Family of unknown function (DUF6311)
MKTRLRLDWLQKRQNVASIAFLTIVILLFYWHRYGVAFFNPTNYSWLIEDPELAAPFFGWNYFRYEPWAFPIGHIQNYFYPLGMNIYFTDVALLSILFKPFSAFLPANFQYIGMWLVLCHILLAWFSIKMCDRLGVQSMLKLLLSAFICFNPVFLFRLIHPGLYAQWIVVACLYVYFMDPKKVSYKRIIAYQFLLLFLSSLVMIYLWLMALGFTFALLLRLCLIDKELNFRYAVGALLVQLSIVATVWWGIGLISFKKSTNYQISGWGDFSLNLNSLYNSMNTSSILPSSPFFSAQQLEGYAYLGAGVILLSMFLTLHWIYKLRWESFKKGLDQKIWYSPLFLFFLCCFLYSLSNKITFNQKILFEYELKGFLLSIAQSFRTSGRFFWPIYYFILIVIIKYLNDLSFNSTFKSTTVGVCLIIQIYDLQYFFNRAQFSSQHYTPPIENNDWEKLIANHDVTLFYPGFQRTYLYFDDYRYFTYYASKYKKKINIGYPARYDRDKIADFSKNLNEKLTKEGLDAATLYVTIPTDVNRLFLTLQDSAALAFELDGYLVFLKRDSENEKTFKSLNAKKPISFLNKFEKINLDPKHNGNTTTQYLKSGFYEIDQSDDHLFLKGWSFLNHPNQLIGDSIKIVLQSDLKGDWCATTTSFPTDDVFDYYNTKLAKNAGFSIVHSKKNLQNGAYKVGIFVKNSQTKVQEVQWTSNTILVNNPAKPVPMRNLPNLFKPLKFGVDIFEDRKEDVIIEGWAFPEAGYCPSCKSSLVAHSKETKYKLELTNVPRPDIVSFFKNPAILNAGFQIRFKKDFEEKGLYQFSLLLEDTLGNTVYFEPINRTLKIGFGEFASPKVLKNSTYGRDSVVAFIDLIDDSIDYYKIDGWAFINKLSTNFSKNYLVLKSSLNSYRLGVDPVLRPDIKDFYHLNYNTDSAGFTVKFRKKDVKPGRYEIGVFVRNRKTEIESFKSLRKTISIE